MSLISQLIASQVAVPIATDKVCTVAMSICVNEPYHNTPTGVGGQAPTAGVFSQCSTELCLHIAAFQTTGTAYSQRNISYWIQTKWKGCTKYILALKLQTFTVDVHYVYVFPLHDKRSKCTVYFYDKTVLFYDGKDTEKAF